VLATIHRFPSLEPLRLQSYPANHLYLPTRRDILHRAVVFEGDATREGNASTKTRYEIRGSARKIRPQKGSGRARLGDKKSPMLRGGGVSHGPKPRDFSTDLPKKVYDLAWRTALSYRFRKGELIIVDNAIEIESPSQRLLQHIFDLHDRERGRGRSLFVTDDTRPLLVQALKRMDRERQALTWEEVDVKDLLELTRIVIERSALHKIFREHSEDLPSQQRLKSSVGSSRIDMLNIPGWEDFSSLVQSPAEEREARRIEIYSSVVADRMATLPEHEKKTPLQTSVEKSAFALLAETFDLQREQLPSVEPLWDAWNQLEDADSIPALEIKVRILEIEKEKAQLVALAAEHMREVYKPGDGQEKEANEQEEEEPRTPQEVEAKKQQDKAREARIEEEGHNIELLETKTSLATKRADDCDIKGDMAGYEEQMEIARVTEKEWEAAMSEKEVRERVQTGEETEQLAGELEETTHDPAARDITVQERPLIEADNKPVKKEESK
jgi:large subunit ribosomal protein L4